MHKSQISPEDNLNTM